VAAETPIAKQQQTGLAFALWVIYAVSSAWASSGLLCWAMWVRNLWGGPEAAERWPIRSDLSVFLILGVMLVLSIPLILVLLVVEGLCKRLWMLFCRKPLKRAEAEAVEMEAGIGCDSGNVTEEVDGDEK
jgi:hypothetical protein